MKGIASYNGKASSFQNYLTMWIAQGEQELLKKDMSALSATEELKSFTGRPLDKDGIARYVCASIKERLKGGEKQC